MSEKPPEKKGFVQEFAHFLQAFGVIGLAIAFVIGTAASKLVSALVNDIVTPLIGLVFQDAGDLKQLSFTVHKSTFAYGDLIANVIDFLIISVLVFLMYRQLSKFKLIEDKTKS